MPDTPLAVVDIDGVLADVRHRVHHVQRRPRDWGAFFRAAPRDPAHPEGLALVAELAETCEVVYLTGRPEDLRQPTTEWLATHGLDGRGLLMRRSHDRRPAAVMKLERLHALAAERCIALVVDDDPLVVTAVRKAGYPVRHADWSPRSQTMLEIQEVEGRS